MRPVDTLIVMANDHKARLYWNRGVGRGLEPAGLIEAAVFPDSDVRYSDRPGRATPGPGMAPRAFDHHRSEEEHERQHFVRHVVAALEAEAGAADRIVLAAAPRMLGALRAALPAPLKARIAAELDKDLLKTPLADLPAHFADVLAL